MCYGVGMNPKPFVTIGLLIGSTVGGFIPYLWHASMFSFSSVLLSGLGGIVGIWAGYKLSQRI